MRPFTTTTTTLNRKHMPIAESEDTDMTSPPSSRALLHSSQYSPHSGFSSGPNSSPTTYYSSSPAVETHFFNPPDTYEHDTVYITDPRYTKPLPPPKNTINATSTVYFSPVLPHPSTFSRTLLREEGLHATAFRNGSYMFIALGADDNGRWKEDVNWDDDTGEYKADAANEEWAEMVLAAFRERCDEAVEVKLYGVAPRFWGWVSFAVKVRREMVRWVQEAGVAVRYLTFAEWQERIEWQFEERRLHVGPRIGPALGIDPLEGYDKDSFEIIEQRRKDIADIRALQEKEEENRKNLRQERLQDLRIKRLHISLKSGQIWRSVSHAIRRLETCCPLFVDLDRTWTVVLFGTEIVGASQRWWDFPYENDVQDWRDTYESTNGQYWFETPFITPALQYANMQLDAIPPGRPFSGHFSVQMSIAGETDHDLPARQYLLDTGSTFPMGYIDDICEIDPRGQRPPQAMISFDTTVGRIPRFVYLVYMQVRDDNEKALTGWHLSPFAINETPYPKVPRLSGLFPFLHAYWAKDPGEDPAFWKVSNRLAGVTGGLRRGKGDDLGL